MKTTINGYAVERRTASHIYVEGRGVITELEAREALRIDRVKRQYESLEEKFKSL